jgi:hypothetical protein
MGAIFPVDRKRIHHVTDHSFSRAILFSPGFYRLSPGARYYRCAQRDTLDGRDT